METTPQRDLIGEALSLWHKLAAMFPTRTPEVHRVMRVQAKAHVRAMRRIRKAA